MLVLFSLRSPNASAQSLPCKTLFVTTINDTALVETDRSSTIVRVDKGEGRLKKDAACVDIIRPGLYKILAGVENSVGQLNESFYLTIRYQDGRLTGAQNPNAGPYRVVQDHDGVKGEPGAKFDTTRDAGIFYLKQGLNTIVLNHYFLIQNDYPDFLNPPDVPINPDNIESVHLFKIEFIYLEDISHDLRLSKGASEDTVFVGELFSYNIKVENLGPSMARSVTVSDTITQSLVIDTDSFSMRPDSLIKETDSSILIWNLGEMTADSSTTISYSAFANDSDFISETPFELINTSFVISEGDTNLANNFSSSTVIVVKPLRLTDVSVFQSVATDSFSVQGSDTLWYVKPGETYSYFITVANQSNVEAVNVNVKDVLPDSVYTNEFAIGDTIQWHLGDLPAFSDTSITLEATVSSEVGEQSTQLINTVIVQADNEDPVKLADNISIAIETVFVIPREKISENCNLFTLDFNVYKPQTGDPLGINFQLESDREVRLDVYDMSGSHIMKLIESTFTSGMNRFEWYGRTGKGQKVGSGVYIITMRSNNLICWKKVILAR